jgi:hypothetical protein
MTRMLTSRRHTTAHHGGHAQSPTPSTEQTRIYAVHMMGTGFWHPQAAPGADLTMRTTRRRRRGVDLLIDSVPKTRQRYATWEHSLPVH